MKTVKIFSFLIVLFIIGLFSCEKTSSEKGYLTRNVFVVVIDGARYSESWGDSTRQNIPRMGNIISEIGVIYTQFYNNGTTYTLSGHTSITTGHYQEIDLK